MLDFGKNRPFMLSGKSIGFLRLPTITLVAAVSVVCATAQNTAIPSVGEEPVFKELPPHPRLLLNHGGLANLKQRIRTEPWARKTWENIKREVDRSMDKPVVLPPRGGNWSHNYVCPEHGARLDKGRRIGEWEWEHHCPTGPHILHGDPKNASCDFDGNGIAQEHANLAEKAVHCGLLFQVTGDERYARRSREILLSYADHYLSYPLHNNQGRAGSGARVASQSLTEAGWVSQMAKGADLVWATFTPEQHTNLAQKLFRPALDQVIIPRPSGIHNIQCHRNSAIGLVGLLLGDYQLINLAIKDPKLGFYQQLSEGVTRDGLWFEGSSGYHFYTISGLWPLAQAAHNCGVDLFTPAFRSMFDGPLRLAMPNGVLPNFNDSGYVELSRQSDLYELAMAHWPCPDYAGIVSNSKRDGMIPLLYGVTNLPSRQKTLADSSRNLPDSGYAILQQGNGPSATWLCLKYGPHGGGHGHPDKNSLILYSRGRVIAPDSGSHAYGSPLHKGWDKTTLAHNTLVVNQTNQASATGSLLAFGSRNGVSYCMATAGPIYPGLSFTRAVAMLNQDLILFIDQIEAEKESLLDVVYHQEGKWVKDTARRTAWKTPELPGYQFLTDCEIHSSSDLTSVNISGPLDSPTTIVLAPTQPCELITGYGILKTTKDLTPILIQRFRGRTATCIWAISLGSENLSLSAQPLQHPSAEGELPANKAILAQVNSGKSKWFVAANPENLPIRELPESCIVISSAATRQ